MSDIDTVIERLRGTLAEKDRQREAEARRDGIEWAKRYATVTELKMILGDDPGGKWDGDTTLVEFLSRKDNEVYMQIGVDLEALY